MAQIPYEFLARWDHQTGVLKGAHIKTFDDVTNREGDAQAVAVGVAAGFPLSDILTSIEVGAIMAADAAIIDLAAEKAAHTATKQALTAAEAALTAAEAALTAANERIAVLEAV